MPIKFYVFVLASQWVWLVYHVIISAADESGDSQAISVQNHSLSSHPIPKASNNIMQ